MTRTGSATPAAHAARVLLAGRVPGLFLDPAHRVRGVDRLRAAAGIAVLVIPNTVALLVGLASSSSCHTFAGRPAEDDRHEPDAAELTLMPSIGRPPRRARSE